MHDLALGDITIAASVMEPAASAVTLTVCVLELRHDGRTFAYANCNAGVLEVMRPEDPVDSCIECNGEKMSPWSAPLVMSNGSESVIVPSGCLRCTTPMTAAR